jgi:hypothetical protein
VTGGTGFIGRRLTEALVEAGHHVTVLTRDKRKAHNLACPVRIVTNLDSLSDDEAFDAVVNLAGAPVAGGRWTARRKEILRSSRIDTTRALVRLIGRLKTKPSVLISASAIGYYGIDSDEPVTENTKPQACFAHDMCAERETEARTACRYGVRVVELRLGLVLDASGGPLGLMMPAFEFGLGARIGAGHQWMSWIQLDDVAALIAFVIARDDLRGPFNAVAPEPCRNAEFSVALARALHRPCVLAVPSQPIRIALGEMGEELLLASKRVLPARLTEAGFAFRSPDITAALRASLRLERDAPCDNSRLSGASGSGY